MSGELASWRVLAVDDEPDNLKLLWDVLEFNGVAVAGATGGEQAIKLADEFRPNVILLDLDMPDMTGWDVQRALRARPDFDNVPIIAITALAMPSDAQRAREAGFDGYITKPFRMQALLTELQKMVAAFANSGNG